MKLLEIGRGPERTVIDRQMSYLVTVFSVISCSVAAVWTHEMDPGQLAGYSHLCPLPSHRTPHKEFPELPVPPSEPFPACRPEFPGDRHTP